MQSRTEGVVVGVFSDLGEAQKAAARLENAGFPKDSIGIVTRSGPQARDEHTSPVENDAAAGAAIGGIGGLVLTFATLTVPGVGPLLAAGPILAALGGAGVGAVAGGLIGALTRMGISEDDARGYAEGIRRGDVLLTVRTSATGADRARGILGDSNARRDEHAPGTAHEPSWTGLDAGAAVHSEDEIRREHRHYKPHADPAYEWRDMDEKERKHAGRDDAGTDWPHKKAYDIGDSLVEAEAENASVDTARTEEAAKRTLGKKPKDLESEVGTPGTHENAGERHHQSDKNRT